MKKMTVALARKGWTKNEIIFELQRIFGNDILMGRKYLDDESTFIGKNYLSILAVFSIGYFMASRRARINQ